MELGKNTGWEPGGVHVQAALKGLTAGERKHVAAGYINTIRPDTMTSLRRKAMFYFHVDSPNGRAGFMRLTPLGENVRALILSRRK